MIIYDKGGKMNILAVKYFGSTKFCVGKISQIW